MDAAAQDLALEDGLSDEGFGLEEGDPPPYMPTLPEGMETSAARPQASSLSLLEILFLPCIAKEGKARSYSSERQRIQMIRRCLKACSNLEDDS